MITDQLLLFSTKVCTLFFTFLSKNKIIRSFLLFSRIRYLEGMFLECTYLSNICMCFGLGLMGWNEKGNFYLLRLQY